MTKKILYLITEDWFFCSHFIERAIAARDSGFDVVVVTRVRQHGEQILSAGLRLVPINIERRSINPFREIALIWTLYKIYRRERPNLLHHVASKPIFYGSLVAKTLHNVQIVNAPVGLGYAFSSMDAAASLIRPLMQLAYRFLLNPKNSKVIFENCTDLDDFVSRKCVRQSDAVLIRGAGVNLAQFRPRPAPEGPVLVVLIARMLRDKGVVEFVTAAQKINADGVTARFVLVGEPDLGNRASISKDTLLSWNGHHGVEWWGWREDIPAVLSQAHVVCLPSYREGLPKSLLEAASCGLPIVTTDAIGCRDVVAHEINGYLVPIRDTEKLVMALISLIINPGLRTEMGRRGRLLAEQEFSSTLIIEKTLEVYGELG
jgi:glycosyltransferase involved in cell wall biosynthesis